MASFRWVALSHMLLNLLKKIWFWRYRALNSLWQLEATVHGAILCDGVTLIGRPIIRCHPNSELRLCRNVKIYSALNSNPLGLMLPTTLRTLAPDSKLIIGCKSGLSGVVICSAAEVTIGENVIIGAGSLIIDNDFHSMRNGEWTNDFKGTARPVRIGNDVFIGARSIILKGVEIGSNSVVGAGSVVTKSIPANSIAGGNPAVVLRTKKVRVDPV